MQVVIPNSRLDKLGLSLILISSALLGIWATMHTIALRNILLGFGGLIAIFYWVEWFNAANKDPSELRPPLLNWIPLALIVSMLFWVVIHFFYFSVDPQRQLDQLSSTWLRAFLATLIGSATGLALIRKKEYAPCLWLGLFFSFLILIGQYIPKALQRHSIFAVDFFSDYIYWAKFNGVLAGTILVAGLLGLLIDYFRIYVAQAVVRYGKGPKYLRSDYLIPAYAFLGIFLATYSFVFIFDAKAGIGLSVILIGLWVLIGSIFFAAKIFKNRKQKNYTNAYIRLISLFLIFVVLISFLSYRHVKNNPGWESLFVDIAISAQIDNYPNWKSPGKYGYPRREDGTMVAGNTYERVSWAAVGLRLFSTQPFGNGLFRSFPEQVKKFAPEFNSAQYTHSAWIDLGLAFGFPGLLLLPIALMVAMGAALMGLSSQYKATVITLAAATLALYSVGEYGFQQGIEILLYLSALLGGLSLTSGPRK